jgi:hypothetical protein
MWISSGGPYFHHYPLPTAFISGRQVHYFVASKTEILKQNVNLWNLLEANGGIPKCCE